MELRSGSSYDERGKADREADKAELVRVGGAADKESHALVQHDAARHNAAQTDAAPDIRPDLKPGRHRAERGEQLA